MTVDTQKAKSHAFQLSLTPEVYNQLFSTLRPESTMRRRRVRQRNVCVELALSPRSSAFQVVKLQSHALPVTLEVPFGTSTHSGLTKLLLSKLQEPAPPLAEPGNERQAFKRILEKLTWIAPSIGNDISSSIAADIALTPPPSSPTISYQHLVEIAITNTLQYDELLSFPRTVSPSINPQGSPPPLEIEAMGPICVEVDGHTATLWNEYSVSGELSSPETVRFFCHWGHRDDLRSPWRDEPVRAIYHNSSRTFEIRHSLDTRRAGSYGATFFYLLGHQTQPHWLGRFKEDDAKFRIFREHSTDQDLHLHAKQSRVNAIRQIKRSLAHHGRVDGVLARIRERHALLSPGKLLSTAVTSLSEPYSVLPTLVREHSLSPSLRAAIACFGIDEILFISPEGPHATAGGLGQVASGLLPALAQSGLVVTLLAPLYSHSLGSKHLDASRTLKKGIVVGEQTLLPQYIGEITVDMPPSYSTSDGRMIRYPTTIAVHLYEAFHASVRLLLLYCPPVFDTLYRAVEANELARRSVIFCRAALETMSAPHVHISPSVVISNDWFTAPIPALARLDQRYQKAAPITQSAFVHMLHNAGRDYHGIFETKSGGEDIWSYLGLSGEHFFGFQDSKNNDRINFTLGGIAHADQIVTVSPHYAEELESGVEAPELTRAICSKKNRTIGISNGINVAAIRKSALSYCALPSGETSTGSSSDFDSMCAAKKLAKHTLQAHMGLASQSNAILLSFVGRLAEQKGLRLLTEVRNRSGYSILEEILRYEPRTQLIIAGPPTSNDDACLAFLSHLARLRGIFPGRVATRIEFVQHCDVLTQLLASDLLLMPSRFEPGGIAQLEALVLATPVVARNVGGLRSTLQNFSMSDSSGNSFLCNEHSAEAYGNTLWWAIDCLRNPAYRAAVMRHAFESKHDWRDRIGQYIQLFQMLSLGTKEHELLDALNARITPSL